MGKATPASTDSLTARVKARSGSWGPRVMSTLGLLGLTAAITAVGQRKGLELVVIGAQAGAYNEGGVSVQFLHFGACAPV